MVRVIVKNTFLSLDEGTEEMCHVCNGLVSSPHPSSWARSRSAECTPTSRNLDVPGSCMTAGSQAASQIEELNRLWSPRPSRHVRAESPWARGSDSGFGAHEPSHVPREGLPLPLGVPDSWLADRSPARSSSPGAQRREQAERLRGWIPQLLPPHGSKGDRPSGAAAGAGAPHRIHRALSSNSVSTMASNSAAASSNRSTVDTDQCTELARPELRPREYHHKHVPKHADFKGEYAKTYSGVPQTTVMVRGIPNSYTQDELVAEIGELGFAGAFDFLYLPLDQGMRHRGHGVRRRASNVGYAFVNFVGAAEAGRFMAASLGHQFRRHRKSVVKVASASPAHLQGLEANAAHYRAAAGAAGPGECRPWFGGEAS